MHSFALPVHTQRGRGGGVVVCEYTKDKIKEINERDGREMLQRPTNAPSGPCHLRRRAIRGVA